MISDPRSHCASTRSEGTIMYKTLIDYKQKRNVVHDENFSFLGVILEKMLAFKIMQNFWMVKVLMIS